MMQPIVFRISNEDRRLLELEAKRAGLPMAEITRKAVKDFLKKRDKRPSAAEVLLKWAKKAKKYKSRYKDTSLSQNYNQYLYGAKSKKFGYLWRKNP